jgi:cyclic pyranopterin phosphate synthase
MDNTNLGLKSSRKIDYLRISVTDRCNLRCNYCIPKEGVYLEPQDQILTFEEIIRLVKILASFGLRRVRLTGGEPLVRKGVIKLIEQLNNIDGIDELCLTTNGMLLANYAEALKQAGISRVNISLDTLRKPRFELISRSFGFSQVMQAIDKVREVGFSSLGLNVVVMKGVNDDEIVDFVNFAKNKGLILKFIEFMKVTPLWRERLFIPIEEVIDVCHKEFWLEKIEYKSQGPAQYYKTESSMVGFIKTSRANCDVCSRLRLTSTGEIKTCLYQPQGLSLRDLLRKGVDDSYIKETVRSLISQKEEVNYTKWRESRVYMSSIGG